MFFINWATKADFIGEHADRESSACKVCSAEQKAIYQVEQNYFLLYWLPLFPTKRVVYRICSSCSFKSKLRAGGSRLLDDHSADKLTELNSYFPKKYKFKYFWGILVFALIAALIAWFVLSVLKS